MRDLVFKNLTSNQRGRKIMSTSEVMERDGIITRVRRNFIYIVKSAKEAKKENMQPQLYVLKRKDSLSHNEKFLCRIKGSLYTVNKDKLFFVVFSHSLSINLAPATHKQ